MTDEEVAQAIAPTPSYPRPWRVAETDGRGHPVVVCAEGHYVCNASDGEAAQIIVHVVNAWEGP